MSAGDGQSAEDTSEDTEPRDDQPETPAVTPQSQELRQQQYAVGVGAAALTGVALAVGSLQQFPGLPEPVAFGAGIVGAGVVYWLVKHSLFPTDEELAGE
ncbi:hypothetical protein SAMN05216226_103194 [Halovenus aranensis]|uniref:Uncharacterized protein n=1 Tax=Halovenus aranensis TaxID=890420 RepID=A0A1G8TQP0_9EURY|nr:hypothetical protein [Halovenus aranensis]SDJ43724.1 hypothetical protein SAMN05216226_103194 [Halovenus aranensis]